jgi:hypothetical protein
MKLELIKENEDGGADYSMYFEEDEIATFVRLGVVAALEKAIVDGENLNPYKGADVE